ncbi:hypothetical protein [Nocardia sp. NPDC059239]|uniref:hypothetical protein n=1 Tax=unclassified Nocardia TaxID=2637762 RepID=UPI0036886358
MFANLQLRALVQAKLEMDWSPRQIGVWLRRTYPEQRPRMSTTKSSTSPRQRRKVLPFKDIDQTAADEAPRSAGVAVDPDIRSVLFITLSNLTDARPTIVSTGTHRG